MSTLHFQGHPAKLVECLPDIIQGRHPGILIEPNEGYEMNQAV